MKLLVLVLLCSVSVCSVAVAKKGEMTFPSAVEVSPREVITMYDIVETKNISEDILSNLKTIEIADQNTKTILKSDLIRKLRGIDAFFLFPNEIKILRSRQNVSRMELERKIKNQLLSKCTNCEYQIQINSVPPNLPSDWSVDLNVDLNKTAVMIPVYSVSQSERKGWITAEIKKHAQTAVLNRSVKIGEVITEDMITVEKRLIQNQMDAVLDSKNIIGMQANRFLSAGQILSFRDLKKETIMKKGQIVKAIFGKGRFDISISAIVEEAGAVGDVIKVKNMDSLKMFAATIVDRGLVKIE
jgi:flagellar basal body P-ring formation protein FlgA